MTYHLPDDVRYEAEDAIRAAMESRRGGLVSDLPTGARNWGEADGYWITMHIEPVLDALTPILAEHFERQGAEKGWDAAEAQRVEDGRPLLGCDCISCEIDMWLFHITEPQPFVASPQPTTSTEEANND